MLNVLSFVLLLAAPQTEAVPMWQSQIQVRGVGYLGVELPDGRLAYARDLNLRRSEQGLLTTEDGYPVVPKVSLSSARVFRVIKHDGTIRILDLDFNLIIDEGRLSLNIFPQPYELKPIGAGLYLETSASGSPVVIYPDEGSAGWIQTLD